MAFQDFDKRNKGDAYKNVNNAIPSMETNKDYRKEQPFLERIGRRVMLICGAIAWGFARSDSMLMLTAGMMIFIYPMFLGFIIPLLTFVFTTEGTSGSARMQAILFSIALTVMCEYFALFGTLGWIKGFISGNGKKDWMEFKQSCLVNKLMIGKTFFVGAGIVLVTGTISAIIVKLVNFVVRPH